MAALQNLGARSVPVVAVGDDFVFAQSLTDVAELLGLDYDSTPELSPGELVRKLEAAAFGGLRRVDDQMAHRRVIIAQRLRLVIDDRNAERVAQAALDRLHGGGGGAPAQLSRE